MKRVIKKILKEQINKKALSKIYEIIDNKYEFYIPQYFRQHNDRDWGIRSVVDGSMMSVGDYEVKNFIENMGFAKDQLDTIFIKWAARHIYTHREELGVDAEFAKRYIDEDLEYYGVEDATKDEYKMDIKEDVPIYKEANPHKKVFNNLKQAFPNTPDYVLQDFFRAQFIKSPKNLSMVVDQYEGDPVPVLGSYWHKFLNGPWKLELLNVNPDDFNDNTVNAFFEREFGDVDAYLVPGDKERTQIQKKIAKGKGMNEPVIIVKDKTGKYELIEGWHRTMAALLLGDNGEDLKNWDKVKLRAWVTNAK